MKPFENPSLAAGLPRLLLTSEIAKALRISERSLERMRVEGSGPPFTRVGRRVVYELGAVRQWLEARRRTSTGEAA